MNDEQISQISISGLPVKVSNVDIDENMVITFSEKFGSRKINLAFKDKAAFNSFIFKVRKWKNENKKTDVNKFLANYNCFMSAWYGTNEYQMEHAKALQAAKSTKLTERWGQ